MNLYIDGFDLYQTPTNVSYEICQGNTYSIFAKYTKWLVDRIHSYSYETYDGDIIKFDELQTAYRHIYDLSVFISNNPNAKFGIV